MAPADIRPDPHWGNADMLEQLEELRSNASDRLQTIDSTAGLEEWFRDVLGRKGELTQLAKQVGKLDASERPAAGKRINEIKESLQGAFDARQQEVKRTEMEAEIAAGAVDVTLPGRRLGRGRLHPITQTLRDIYRIWGEMGFQVYQSREIENDEFNFSHLNIPEHHPARDMWDTFHTTTPGLLLRTHTSPGQIHAMHEYHPEPIRVILPGTVYRYEQVTARSECQFNQVEGLAVGTDISLADLKGCLADFARRMFGAERNVRFRANYFPFTEPSAEMDVECIICHGTGCNVCKNSGWLEILGSGMVHPNVLRNGGYDPEQYSGFAFGMGVERICMLKYGIRDIRYFWGNDLRFLSQF